MTPAALPRRLAVLALAASLSQAPLARAGVNGYLQESVSLRTNEGDVIFHRQTLNVKVEEALSKIVFLRAEADRDRARRARGDAQGECAGDRGREEACRRRAGQPGARRSGEALTRARKGIRR